MQEDGKAEPSRLANKVRMPLRPDQRVVVETPGGYCPASKRAPELVEADRRSGKVRP